MNTTPATNTQPAWIDILRSAIKELEMNDGATTPVNEMEMEAEGAAFLLTTLLDLPGKAESRGYIQNWAKGSQFTEKMAQRVLSAANKILKAGQEVAEVA